MEVKLDLYRYSNPTSKCKHSWSKLVYYYTNESRLLLKNGHVSLCISLNLLSRLKSPSLRTEVLAREDKEACGMLFLRCHCLWRISWKMELQYVVVALTMRNLIFFSPSSSEKSDSNLLLYLNKLIWLSCHSDLNPGSHHSTDLNLLFIY